MSDQDSLVACKSLSQRSGSSKNSLIFIFHTEGTIKYNPGLNAIASFLVEANYKVIYWFVETRELENVSIPGVKTKPLTPFIRKILSAAYRFHFTPSLGRLICRAVMGSFPAAVAGVDRNGIIYAAKYSSIVNIPKALLSYEIYFENEVGIDYKQDEINACNGLAFAVCQDPVRSQALSKENKIPLKRIIHMPVSPCGHYPCVLNKEDERRRLGIKQKYVAVFSGSFARWTMFDSILKLIDYWPMDWALVLRGRANQDQFPALEKASSHPSVYINSTSNNEQAFYRLLSIADVGIALYQHLESSISAGMNMKYIGLSSGKISSYLSHSIPVLCNQIGIYSDLINAYHAGVVVDSPGQIPKFLESLDEAALSMMKIGAQQLFSQRIDADIYKSSITNAFNQAVYS
jgi:hypothetical protein